MNDADADRRIAQAMRRYFDLRRELADLKRKLEEARTASGEDIASFYDPGHNASQAAQILRLHHVRREMAKLMQAAQTLVSEEGRGRQVSTETVSTIPKPL